VYAKSSTDVPAWVEARVNAGMRCEKFEPMFKKMNLPVKVFSYIAYRESRCAVSAVNARFDKHGRIVWALNKNGTYDSGLLQINSSWKTVTKQACRAKEWDKKLLLNVKCNVAVAKVLYEDSGLQPWGF
jgi:hypothetical protein